MAVLSKIRERSLFLIIIIALALFSFVLSGIFKGNVFNKNTTNVGEINGEPITREDFAKEVDFNRSRSKGSSSNFKNITFAWNTLVSEKIYETQLKKSGIIVGEKDIWDALITQVSAQNNPLFMNEAGLFDEEKLKEYIATLEDNSGENEEGRTAWTSWLSYEKNVKKNLEQNTYNSLIKAGLGRTLKEGKSNYLFQNTNVDLKYVYVPFVSLQDSLVKITQDDIKEYVKKHRKEYEVNESRDIKFVSFDVKATEEDEKEIKSQLNSLINDREEYSKAAKTKVNVTGFKNAVNMEEFNADNGSDEPIDTNFYTKKKLPKVIADTIFNLNINEVYGPYKDGEFYKLSKITAIKQLPDSVKASHILIPFVGSATADASVTQNEEEAKKQADSILNIVRTDNSKFEKIAKEMSVDKVSAAKGGDLGWFVYTTMIPEFRDFVFENKVGEFGVVKSRFGFHIIRIDDQKNHQKVVQLATFSRKIYPSEKTENGIFEKAETFASKLSSGEDMKELAKSKDYKIRAINNIEVFEFNLSTLGSQRQIVKWLFEENTKENDIKRFDTDKGYTVVMLTKINKKGYSVRGRNVRQIIINQKKAELIKNRTSGETLEEIAKQNSTVVRTSIALSNASPIFSGQGRFVEIAGVVTSLEENSLAKNIVGKSGVAFALVNKKTIPEELKNYNAVRKNLERELLNRNKQIYNAIKDNSEIVDNRAYFY